MARRRSRWLPSDPWNVAAAMCLFAGAVLLVIAWYDVSGTADVYKQLPYLVSAGFTGLAFFIVGGALLIAGRGDRIDRRLSQLLDAITEAATPAAADFGESHASLPPPLEPTVGQHEEFVVAAGGRTYHRADCLLLRGKDTSPVAPADLEANALTPCPVCGPSSSP